MIRIVFNNQIKGVSQLAVILQEETDDKIRSATIWSLGQIGCHTTEHAKAIAVANVLPRYFNRKRKVAHVGFYHITHVIPNCN